MDNKVLNKIKKDIIIQYCLDIGNYNSRTSINIKFIVELIKSIDDSEFSIEEFDLDFEERKTAYNKQTFKINIAKIKFIENLF